MKNVIKFTALATMMSTAAFANGVPTTWTTIDYDAIVSGSAPSGAFNTAATNLVEDLGGQVFTKYSTGFDDDGNLALIATDTTYYSDNAINAHIGEVKEAFEDDMLGTDGLVDLDGGDGGILDNAAKSAAIHLTT